MFPDCFLKDPIDIFASGFQKAPSFYARSISIRINETLKVPSQLESVRKGLLEVVQQIKIINVPVLSSMAMRISSSISDPKNSIRNTGFATVGIQSVGPASHGNTPRKTALISLLQKKTIINSP